MSEPRKPYTVRLPQHIEADALKLINAVGQRMAAAEVLVLVIEAGLLALQKPASSKDKIDGIRDLLATTARLNLKG